MFLFHFADFACMHYAQYTVRWFKSAICTEVSIATYTCIKRLHSDWNCCSFEDESCFKRWIPGQLWYICSLTVSPVLYLLTEIEPRPNLLVTQMMYCAAVHLVSTQNLNSNINITTNNNSQTQTNHGIFLNTYSTYQRTNML